MYRHYLKIILRTVQKSKIYTLINVSGLSTGMVVFLLIMLYVNYEFSVDGYHDNKDRIYRIAKQEIGNMYLGDDRFAVTMAPLGPAVKAEFPEVEKFARICRDWNVLIKAEEKTHLESTIYGIDPDAFEMFTFKYLYGDPQKYLKDKYSAVITASTARKYFGDQDPVGKTFQYEDKDILKVIGVIEDMPVNSQFRMNVMLPFETLMEFTNNSRYLDNWESSSFYTYVMLNKSNDPGALEAKFPVMWDKYTAEIDDINSSTTRLFLQRFSDIYLHSDIHFDLGATVDIRQLYIYETIAFLILLIACINYMNLASARSALRAREVGIRKVAGANRRDLIFQFLGESVLITFISLGISVIIIVLVMPYFEQFTELDLAVNLIEDPGLLLQLVGLCLAVGLISGSYPAFMLSAFMPMAVLKGSYVKTSRGSRLRNGLVVAQFAISGCLIIASLIITQQLDYIQNKDMGYQREHIVTFRLVDEGLISKMGIFKDSLLSLSGVREVASSSNLPNYISSNTNARWPGKPDDIEWSIYEGRVDENFCSLYEIQIVRGRNFDPAVDKPYRAALINESAAEALGWENPIGMELINWQDTARIVGVMKDFHQHSLHQAIMPLQLFYNDQERYISVRISGENINETISEIQQTKEAFSDTYPFSYAFFDDEFARTYKKEQKTGKAAGWFTIITIIIACLGLYGLATFTAEQRIKEVGIRKVLGAQAVHLVYLLSRDFTYPVIISFVIAVPIAYYFMGKWLADFAYHIPMNFSIFLVTFIGMIFISWLTVGYRTFKVASSNPVDALKEE